GWTHTASVYVPRPCRRVQWRAAGAQGMPCFGILRWRVKCPLRVSVARARLVRIVQAAPCYPIVNHLPLVPIEDAEHGRFFTQDQVPEPAILRLLVTTNPTRFFECLDKTANLSGR